YRKSQKTLDRLRKCEPYSGGSIANNPRTRRTPHVNNSPKGGYYLWAEHAVSKSREYAETRLTLSNLPLCTGFKPKEYLRTAAKPKLRRGRRPSSGSASSEQ